MLMQISQTQQSESIVNALSSASELPQQANVPTVFLYYASQLKELLDFIWKVSRCLNNKSPPAPKICAIFI